MPTSVSDARAALQNPPGVVVGVRTAVQNTWAFLQDVPAALRNVSAFRQSVSAVPQNVWVVRWNAQCVVLARDEWGSCDQASEAGSGEVEFPPLPVPAYT
jgi:hypothetical protein